MKKTIWLSTIGMLVLIAAGIYSALNGPLPHSVLTSDELPASVSVQKPSKASFRTYQDGDDLYILYQHDAQDSYVDISMNARKRFSKPVITATIRHAYNDSSENGIGVLKLPGISADQVKVSVRDVR